MEYKNLCGLDVIKKGDIFLVHRLQGVNVWAPVHKAVIGQVVLPFDGRAMFRRPIRQKNKEENAVERRATNQGQNR